MFFVLIKKRQPKQQIHKECIYYIINILLRSNMTQTIYRPAGLSTYMCGCTVFFEMKAFQGNCLS